MSPEIARMKATAAKKAAVTSLRERKTTAPAAERRHQIDEISSGANAKRVSVRVEHGMTRVMLVNRKK